MNRRFVVLMLLLVIGFGFTGCMNVSTLQTARALKVGEHRVVAGGGLVGGTVVEDTGSDATFFPWEGGTVYPHAEVGFRTGVAENLEFGAKWNVPTSLGADVKYQFLDIGGFAAAVGLGGNYEFFDVSDSNLSSSALYFNLQVPLYLSYDFSKYITLYGAPRYLFGVGTAHDSPSDSDERTTAIWHMLGGSTGLRVGDAWGFFGEVSVMAALNIDRMVLIQGSGAVFFDF